VGHPIATRRWHREVTVPGIRTGEREARRKAGSCVLAPYVVCVIAESREQALREAKGQIGFYLTTELYHSILDLHGLREVGQACRAAFRRFDMKALAEAVPDDLVDEIAVACTADEARDRLAQWDDLTQDPLFYPPSVGVRPERVLENAHAILDVFGSG
jgi:alkanesulfonate monooxygenase SsuD/methylene tetrahydromethanopterin reductase-like flavin-dependent oxidoreductase (luciferase family)